MAEFPALPLFTDAYIADTAHLTNEEHGVYMRLLMFAWRTPACALPDNDARLALMVGVTKGKWAKLKPEIMPFWKLSEIGWTQKKLSAQRAFVSKQRKQKSVAGIASSEARRLKSLNSNPTAVPTAVPTAGQQPIPIPITTVKKEKDTIVSKEKKRKTRIPENAVISDNQIKYATTRGHKFPEAEAQFGKFKNNALAKGLLYLDWDRAFVTWLDSEYFKPILGGQHGKRNNNGQTRGDAQLNEAVERAIRIGGLPETQTESGF